MALPKRARRVLIVTVVIGVVTMPILIFGISYIARMGWNWGVAPFF